MALNLLPKGTGRRRAIDEVERLRADNIKLLARQAAADDAFMLQHQQLADARSKQGEAEELVVKQQADIDDLTDERDQLRGELAALKVRFGPQLAAEANANAITVPPMVRPIDGPEDQATEPIDVRPLHAAAAAGLLGPVTDPGRIA